MLRLVVNLASLALWGLLSILSLWASLSHPVWGVARPDFSCVHSAPRSLLSSRLTNPGPSVSAPWVHGVVRGSSLSPSLFYPLTRLDYFIDLVSSSPSLSSHLTFLLGPFNFRCCIFSVLMCPFFPLCLYSFSETSYFSI